MKIAELVRAGTPDNVMKLARENLGRYVVIYAGDHETGNLPVYAINYNRREYDFTFWAHSERNKFFFQSHMTDVNLKRYLGTCWHNFARDRKNLRATLTDGIIHGREEELVVTSV